MTDVGTLYRTFLSCPGGVVTDSRRLVPGAMFIALKGGNFDGNLFAAAALEGGCSYAMVDDPGVIPPGEEGRFLLVDDGLEALRMLAREHRRALGTKLIGVTGTNGKTTTKELLRAVLSRKYRVLATEGNLNNDIGVPLTLLRLRPEHELGIIEMGASHPGDIRRLVEVAEPDFGVITNVGEAHLQGFGSVEGVARTKGELYDFLRTRKGAEVFLNADDVRLCGMAAGLPAVTYGTTEQAGVCGETMDTSGPCFSFRWHRADSPEVIHDVRTHLIGGYNLANVLAACAAGVRLGVPDEDICVGIESYVPIQGRSRLVDTGRNRVVADAYNANPTSMEAALRNFAQMDAPYKMAVLGDMKELGEASENEHRRILRLAVSLGFDRLVLVGPEFASALVAEGVSASCGTDARAVGGMLREMNPEGCLILLKGSHSMDLESLLPLL